MATSLEVKRVKMSRWLAESWDGIQEWRKLSVNMCIEAEGNGEGKRTEKTSYVPQQTAGCICDSAIVTRNYEQSKSHLVINSICDRRWWLWSS
jgi:hypothetical protein